VYREKRDMKYITQCGLLEHKRMLDILKRLIKKYPDLSEYSEKLIELEKEAKSIKNKDSKYEKLVLGEKIFQLSYPIVDYVWEREEKSKFISKSSYRYFARLLLCLKNMAAWRDKKESFVPYNREDKEGLNAMVFFVLLENDKDLNGTQYNLEACVAHILKRIMRSSYLGDSSPENKKWYAEHVDGYEESRKRYVLEKSLVQMPFMLASRIFSAASKISEHEMALFKRAQGIVNFLEYDHIMKFLMPNEAAYTLENLKKCWDKDENDPLFSKGLYEVFGFISIKERNMIRWQKYNRSVNCNLSGHMLETAVWSWVMTFERNHVFKNLDAVAADLFRIGLFHDLPEVDTGDMDSPLKDGVVLPDDKTLREPSEECERNALANFFYPHFSENVREFFEKNVCLESLEGPYKEEYHKAAKEGDYFDADWELIYNIHNGSCSKKFMNIIKRSIKKKRTPKSTAVLREMYFTMKYKKFWDV